MLSRAGKILRGVFNDYHLSVIFIVLDCFMVLILGMGLGADFKRNVFTFSFAEPVRLLMLKFYLGASFLIFVALAASASYLDVRRPLKPDDWNRRVSRDVRWAYAVNWPWIPVVLILVMVPYYLVRGFLGVCSMPGKGLALFLNHRDAERARQEARQADQERIIEEEARRAGGTTGLKR